MDSNWQLMKEGVEGTPKVHEWLQAKLNDDDSVGYDPTYIAASALCERKRLWKQTTSRPLQDAVDRSEEGEVDLNEGCRI